MQNFSAYKNKCCPKAMVTFRQHLKLLQIVISIFSLIYPDAFSDGVSFSAHPFSPGYAQLLPE